MFGEERVASTRNVSGKVNETFKVAPNRSILFVQERTKREEFVLIGLHLEINFSRSYIGL